MELKEEVEMAFQEKRLRYPNLDFVSFAVGYGEGKRK